MVRYLRRAGTVAPTSRGNLVRQLRQSEHVAQEQKNDKRLQCSKQPGRQARARATKPVDGWTRRPARLPRRRRDSNPQPLDRQAAKSFPNVAAFLGYDNVLQQ